MQILIKEFNYILESFISMCVCVCLYFVWEKSNRNLKIICIEMRFQINYRFQFQMFIEMMISMKYEIFIRDRT